MPRKLPISPKIQLIPFQNPNFNYGDFEGYFVDFLNLHPTIEVSRSGIVLSGRVTHASRYELSGDAQNGIDIRAEVQVMQPDGITRQEIWAFQCKHRATWSATQNTAAIELAEKKFTADFYFLLVTCALGTKTVDEAATHPKWQVWSVGRISSELRKLPNQDEAARLVNTYFGPEWAGAMLGLTVSSPLQSAGAFFASQMEAGSLHHHLADVVGRETELTALQEFLHHEEQRLMILPGVGGSGKSRLLKAFAQSLTPKQRSEWSIRFYEDIGIPLTETDIRAIAGRAVIVIDDAHRERLEPLLRFLFRFPKIKIILSTRPQGIAMVRHAAVNVNIDARLIYELPILRKLTQTETTRVVESLLGAEFSGVAPSVVAQSNDCLLIAVVACSMIQRGDLAKQHLASHAIFEQAVFGRLLKDGMGSLNDYEVIERMLNLISLAGPIPREGPWFDLLCQWAAPTSIQHQVRTLLEKLKLSGLLTEKSDGYRITPDLLSDYVLFKAVFDGQHRDTGLVADFLGRVPEAARDEALSRCLPNLAEVEWRARCEAQGQQQSVVEPLMERWLNEFHKASFHRRREMIGHWSRFGVYLPEQSLRIAIFAKEQLTSPLPNEPHFFGSSQETYQEVLDACVPLIKEVARYHPENFSACLDFLWSIGGDEPKRMTNHNLDHPLAAIVELAQIEYRKPLSLNEQALTWMEHHFRKAEIIARLHQPVWWFRAFLAAFLKHSVEDRQYGEDMISLQHIPINEQKVAGLRYRVLSLVSMLAEEGNEGTALNAIKVLGEAMKMVNIPRMKNDEGLQKAWLSQRKDALARLASVAQRYPSPFIHWAIWQELWWHIDYEPAELLRADCWRVFELLKDTFDLRLVRATCSTGDSELTPLHTKTSPLKIDDHDWDTSRELWLQVCQQTAAELATQHQDGNSLHDYLADFVQHGNALGYHPRLGNLLLPLASAAPELARGLAQEMLVSDRPEIHHAFGSLLDGLNPLGTSVDLSLVEMAAKSANETLQIEAGRLLLWWQRQHRLPAEGETLLAELASNGNAELLHSVLSQASLMGAEHDDFIVRLLTSVLGNPASAQVTEPLLAALDRVRKKGASKLPADLVSNLLARLVPTPRLEGTMETYHLNHLAETHPKEVFVFLRQRVEYSRDQEKFDESKDQTYEALPSHSNQVSLRSFAVLEEFEVEFVKIREALREAMLERQAAKDNGRIYESGGYLWDLRQLARGMLEECGSKFETLASAWLALIITPNDLWLFLDVVVGDSPTLVLGHPEVLRQLLARVESQLPQQLDTMRKDLMHSASRWVGASRNPQWRRRSDETPAEEAEPWHIIPRVEKQISNHAHKPILKAFYEELLIQCRQLLSYRNRSVGVDDEE